MAFAEAMLGTRRLRRPTCEACAFEPPRNFERWVGDRRPHWDAPFVRGSAAINCQAPLDHPTKGWTPPLPQVNTRWTIDARRASCTTFTDRRPGVSTLVILAWQSAYLRRILD